MHVNIYAEDLDKAMVTHIREQTKGLLGKEYETLEIRLPGYKVITFYSYDEESLVKLVDKMCKALGIYQLRGLCR